MVLAFAVAFAGALGLARVPVPLVAGWFHGLTQNPLIDTAGPNLYAATAMFIVGGLGWAALYGLVVEPRLHGSAWQRGAAFALIPWLFSLAIFLPIVGGGFLGLDLGAGPLPIVGNFLLHMVYGLVLGVVFGTAESVFDRPRHQAYHEELLAGRLSEMGAARGLLIGVLCGIGLGWLGVTVMPQTGAMNPLAMILAISLTGAAFGGFVGSLSTA